MSQHLAKNAALMTFASVGQKLIAFVYFLFLARVMMPERTGIFFLVTSVIIMFSVLSDLGLTSVIIREIAKRPNDRVQITRRAIGLKLVLIVLSIVAVFVASLLFHYDAQITHLIWVTIIVMVLDAFSLLFFGILRGLQQLRFEAVGIVLGQLVTVLVGGISLLWYPDLRLLILALICGSLMNLAVASTQVVRLYGWQMIFPKWDNHEMLILVKIMIPFAFAGIFIKIFSSLDVLLISKMMNITAVGIYAVAYKFTYAFQFLPLAFSAALYPSLSATIENDPNATTKIFSRAIWYILLIATPIVFGIWLVAPEMVALTGHGYKESISILRVLIFVLFPSFLEIPLGNLLNASNRQSFRMKMIGATVVLNTVIDVLLIPHYGLMGAVFGSLLSYSFLIIGELIIVSTFLPNLFNRIFLRNVCGTFLSGVLMFGVGMMIKPFMNWFLLIPCAVFFYVFFLFITRSITKQDFIGVSSIFRKSRPFV